jgi:hypothetical protein
LFHVFEQVPRERVFDLQHARIELDVEKLQSENIAFLAVQRSHAAKEEAILFDRLADFWCSGLR